MIKLSWESAEVFNAQIPGVRHLLQPTRILLGGFVEDLNCISS
jgi:hypothetical protein